MSEKSASASQPQPWYSIRPLRALSVAAAATVAGAAAAPAASAEIFIYGDIGDDWWNESVSARNFVAELEALNVAAITVRIASIGGSAPDGIAIHNAFKRHPATITTVVDSIACSIAALIAVGGDRVEMYSNALMMIHGGHGAIYGNAGDHRKAATTLDTWNTAMAASFATRTNKPVAEVLPWVAGGDDMWFTADQALAAGLIDGIVDGAPPVAPSETPAGPTASAMARYRMPAAIVARLASITTPAAAAASSTTERNPMPGTTTTTATDDQAAVVAAAQARARTEGAQAEAQRRTDVRAQFTPFAARSDIAAELVALQATCENDVACTAAATGMQILALLAKGVTSAAGGNPRIQTIEDEADKFRGAAVESILARAAIRGADGKYVQASTSNPMRGMKLLDIARASLQRAGVRTEGMDQMRVVGTAFTQTTSDFPVLLETAMHKTLQAAYALQADTWRRFCKIGSVSDFRPHNRYRLGSFGNLDLVPETAEFKNKPIPDGERSVISAVTKGYIVNLSRQAIINDDMGAFNDLGTYLGRAAKRTIEADVYALIAANPIMPDGYALFSLQHGNLAAAGAAPSVASFEGASIAMRQQKDVSGNDYLDIRPAIWLGPVGISGDAKVVNNSEYDPDSANKLMRPNKSRGLFTDIVDSPRLTGTAWYGLADPNQAPVFEVAFLDGNQEPFLDQHTGFTVDGTQWKVRLDYGVAPNEYRGGFKNPGA